MICLYASMVFVVIFTSIRRALRSLGTLSARQTKTDRLSRSSRTQRFSV